MADVTLKYKGATIGELSESGSKTIETAGKYCEADILLEYVRPEGGDIDPMPDLPTAYTKVNSVHIPNGGYINTGVAPTSTNSKYIIDARIDTPIATINGALNLIGLVDGNTYLTIGAFAAYSGFTFQLLSGTSYVNVGTKDNVRHLFFSDYCMAVCSVDDEKNTLRVTGPQTTTKPIIINGRLNGATLERNGEITVWRYIHYIGFNKAIDLIPCQRKSDGQYGFYDLVSESFFGNSGTGTFTEGVE